ncbi:MAG: DUF1707 SHOCT-like domain-containing protein [Micromonosporaceae bacterium]
MSLREDPGMTENREIRASDQDRERVVEVLRTHYSEGRLNLEEFDERVAGAYGSKTLGDLLDLTSDLPGEIHLGPEPAGAAPSPREHASGPARRLPSGLPLLIPALFALLVISSFPWGGIAYRGHHNYATFFPWPLLLFLVIFLARGRRWRGNGRGLR